jgi:methylamine dehydrogenase heavy chain
MTKTLSTLLLTAFIGVSAQAELPPEKIPATETLSAEYPDTWMFAHDANFFSLVTGKVVIFDAAAETQEYKGAIDAAQFATFMESSTRPELYVAESHYERTTRGKRTDVITIYDKASLNRIDEIVLPGTKRAQIVTNKYSMQLVDNDKYLLVFGFTPATSVFVIDIAERKLLNEVQVPGCSMIYPAGKRGFVSMCGDGSLLHVALNKDGSVKAQDKTTGVFDASVDPLFDKPAYYKGAAYYPTFKGDMQVIKMGEKVKPKKIWSLLNDVDRAEGWRPSGWQIASINDKGELFMLMRKNAKDGDHKFGGDEVWVYDVKKKKRTRRIALAQQGFSIEASSAKSDLLVVTNVNMGVDVYNQDGDKQRELSGIGMMPIILHSKR